MKRNFKSIIMSVVIPLLIAFFMTENVLGLPMCKGQSANIGETMKQVAAKCGDAILKEHRTLKVEEVDEEGIEHITVTNIDEWTYDTGKEELVQVLRFENSKLVKISIPGNGVVRDFAIDTCRNGEALSVGDSMVETYLKCGDPLWREALKDSVEETENNGRKRRIYVPVSEWTYRYGPDAPGYTVTFKSRTPVLHPIVAFPLAPYHPQKV
jgi:hypothetical protein